MHASCCASPGRRRGTAASATPIRAPACLVEQPDTIVYDYHVPEALKKKLELVSGGRAERGVPTPARSARAAPTASFQALFGNIDSDDSSADHGAGIFGKGSGGKGRAPDGSDTEDQIDILWAKNWHHSFKGALQGALKDMDIRKRTYIDIRSFHIPQGALQGARR